MRSLVLSKVALAWMLIGCGDDAEGHSLSAHESGAADATIDADAADAASTPDARLDANGDDPTDARAAGDAADTADVLAPCVGVCTPPTAGFQLSASSGTLPLAVSATSTAQAADALVETLYDWGVGDGFASAAQHVYRKPGTFTVTQRVRAQNGLSAAASVNVIVSTADFVPVRFSQTDRTEGVGLSASGYDVEFNGWGGCGVRSNIAIAPGSGVFYFEGQRLTSQWHGGGLGVATASATLGEQAGSSAQSMGVLAWGPVQSTGGVCSGSASVDSIYPNLGFVIDYRAATPIIHVLQQDASGVPTVQSSCTMSASAPLYLYYSGDRSRVGYELHINTGADTTNFPFHYSQAAVQSALRASGLDSAASALVFGFGKTRAPSRDTPPTLSVPSELSVALGQPVSLAATANDAEDGPLSDRIHWRDLAAQHHLPVEATGPSFRFTPTTLGRHPVEVTVADADGVTTTARVMVKVTGALPRFQPVQLVRDALTGPGITVSPDGLSASFNGTSKDGIRANQGVYGKFWYFEVHRESPIRNMGMGLVIAEGALNPYEPLRVPWSCSVNVMRGFWVQLIEAGDWTKDPQNPDTDYGFAVDYTGLTPRVHVILKNALQITLALEDTFIPLYPMLYGNPPDAPVSGYDLTFNFGSKPFAFDVRSILSANNIDTRALELGWGLSQPVVN